MTWSDYPNAPAVGTALCAASDVRPGVPKGVFFGPENARFHALVLQSKDGIRAYVNLCPHFRIPLNGGDGPFLRAGDILWCRYHSAQFREEDGFCIDGPCKGGRLEPVPVLIEADGTVRIAGDPVT